MRSIAIRFRARYLAAAFPHRFAEWTFAKFVGGEAVPALFFVITGQFMGGAAGADNNDMIAVNGALYERDILPWPV